MSLMTECFDPVRSCILLHEKITDVNKIIVISYNYFQIYRRPPMTVVVYSYFSSQDS